MVFDALESSGVVIQALNVNAVSTNRVIFRIVFSIPALPIFINVLQVYGQLRLIAIANGAVSALHIVNMNKRYQLMSGQKIAASGLRRVYLAPLEEHSNAVCYSASSYDAEPQGSTLFVLRAEQRHRPR